jgi:hypothetical protein
MCPSVVVALKRKSPNLPLLARTATSWWRKKRCSSVRSRVSRECEEAVPRLRIVHLGGEAITLNSLARVDEADGQHIKALERNERAVQLFMHAHDYLSAAETLRNRGRLYLRTDERSSRRSRTTLGLKSETARSPAASAFLDAAQLFERAGAADTAADARREAEAVGKRQRIPWWGWSLALIAAVGILAFMAIFLFIAFFSVL